MKAVKLPKPPPELEPELPLELAVDIADEESPLLLFPRPNPLIAMPKTSLHHELPVRLAIVESRWQLERK
jgi:hypothetical protein